MWRGRSSGESASVCRLVSTIRCLLLPPSLHWNYPASLVLRTYPPPQDARPVRHRRPVGRPRPHHGVSRVARVVLVYMLPPVPGAAAVFVFTQFLQPCQTSPIRFSGRPAHRPFRGFFCVHSRCGLHTRTATSTWQALPKGFGHIVTSIAAPVATGWSRGVGLTPTGKAPPFHGAQRTESFSITHYRAVPLHDFGDW